MPVKVRLVNATIDHVVNELVNEPLIGALRSRIGIHSSRFMNQPETRKVQRPLNLQKFCHASRLDFRTLCKSLVAGVIRYGSRGS